MLGEHYRGEIYGLGGNLGEYRGIDHAQALHVTNAAGSVDDRAMIILSAHWNGRAPVVISIEARCDGCFESFVADDVGARAHLVVDEICEWCGPGDTPAQFHAFENAAAIAAFRQEIIVDPRRRTLPTDTGVVTAVASTRALLSGSAQPRTGVPPLSEDPAHLQSFPSISSRRSRR